MNSLTVIIATAGRETLLERTLLSIEACDQPPAYQGLIVVENGPACGAEEVVKRFVSSLRARYLYYPEPNKSAALNAAVSSCDTDLLFFSDDDVRFEKDVLVRYARAAEGISQGKYFGGPVAPDYEKRPPEWLRLCLPASARGWVQSEGKSDGGGHYFLGFNWAAFRTDILKAGGFDPDRGPGPTTLSPGQETDMQIRLLESGVERCYVPDALVWHYVPRERCSIRWVLSRGYRRGIEAGLMGKAAVLRGALPRGSHRIVATARTAALVAKYSALMDKTGVFHAVYHWFREMGVAAGAKKASRLATSRIRTNLGDSVR